MNIFAFGMEFLMSGFECLGVDVVGHGIGVAHSRLSIRLHFFVDTPLFKFGWGQWDAYEDGIRVLDAQALLSILGGFKPFFIGRRQFLVVGK